MATLEHPEPLHLYSGWGNHISPSNSKWIHENLKDMDTKVNAMYKLIEGDADSFARKADMYYKRRPELKNLVEEFYRGYRALAERYEHSTRMLRHAHRTMAEVFPNQMPFLLSDESPYSLSPHEVERQHPKMFLSPRAQFDTDDLKKEASGLFSDFSAKRRIGPDFEESELLSGRKGVKQYNQMLAAGEREAHANSSEGKVREVLNFLEEEVKVRESKARTQDQEAKVRHDANIVISNLQRDISQLSSEIHVLKDQIMEESKRANNAEHEVKSFKGILSELNTENDASRKRISSLELLLSHTENELKKLNMDMEEEIKNLKNVEELNQTLQLDLETLQKKQTMQESGINQKQKELEKLQATLQEKYQKCLEAELALESSEKKYTESLEEVKSLGLDIQKGIEKLNNSEVCNAGLQEEICNFKKENSSLNEQKVQDALMIKGLQDEIMLLEEKKKELEDEVSVLLQEKVVLHEELDRVKDGKSDLEERHQEIAEKLQALSTCVESLQAAIKELQNGNDELKEVCRKYEGEKELLAEKLQDMDKISEKNVMLEKFLLDANFELTVLREKVLTLETTHESLKSEISIYMNERDSLASQVKILSENVVILSGNNAILENSLSDANREVESLRSKLKGFEDSYQILSDKNSILMIDNNALISQADNVAKNLVSWEIRYAEVMNTHLKLLIEKDLMVNEAKELEEILKIEKQQHETLLETYRHLLATSEKQMSILQDNNQCKENEIKKLVNSLSNLEGDNQQMHLEISVLSTLLKHVGTDAANLGSQKYSIGRALEVEKGRSVALGNEKHALLERIEILITDMEASNQREEVLKNEIKVLNGQLIDLQEAIQATQSEITNLIEEKHSLSLDFCNLKKQHNILEEEHVEVLAEALNLNHLYLLFHSLHAERVTELKSLSNDLESLHVIKNNLTNEIKKLNEKISLLEVEKIHFSESVSYVEEELKNRLLSLEFDLNLHNETTRNILIEKETQVSEANQKVKSSKDENMQLKELLEAFELDNAEFKLVKEAMEEKVLALSELVTSRNEEIRCLNEENKMMERDIEEMHRRVELLKCREEQLVSELEKEMSEVQQCEGEIIGMMTEIQILTVNAEVRDEKFHKLIIERESNSIVQKELLVFELCFAKEYMEELQNKLNDLEGENKWLKADLDANLLMLESLWDAVSLMEEQIMSFAQLKLLSNQAKEGFLTSYQYNNSNQSTEINGGTKAAGVLLLEKLNDKFKSLQIVVGDTITLLEQEMTESSANLDAARKEVEILKAKGLAVPGTKDPKLPKGQYNETIKDIQLDVASSSLPSLEFVSGQQRNINGSEIDGLSADAENEAASVGKDDEYSSSFKLITKELLNTNELSSSKRSFESQPEWNRTVQEKLDSDCQRLLDLKTIIEDLKRRANSLKDKLPASYGYDSIQEQLKESEAALLELTDMNGRLKIMSKNCAPSNESILEPEDNSSVEARHISRQGRLEVNLHKIQYVLMKLEEKYAMKQQRTRVPLRDYLYGRRDDHKQTKANPFCGFRRPKIKGGY